MNQRTLEDVAHAIDATLDGPGRRRIDGIATLDAAGPDQLAYAATASMLDGVLASQAGAVIVADDFPDCAGRSLLRAAQPKAAFIRALELFQPDRSMIGVHPTAVIADGARLGNGVAVGPHAVVDGGAVIGSGTCLRAGCYVGGGVEIGEDCDIGPNAALMHGTRIGARCILHAGVVLGADGYGYQWTGDRHHKIPQIGVVVLGDDVEIGANSCIDRATLGETRIGAGSKLDNLVHIAHNNRIGRHVLLTAQVGIAGSSRLGDGVVIGGQGGVSDHVEVGDGVQIGGQSGVFDDVADGAKLLGTPAREIMRTVREQALIGRLPDMRQRLRAQHSALQELSERLAALEARLADR